jgi:hypothetical protein
MAETINITSPSRRAVITGASTLAAASAVNVVAITTTRSAEPDPILEAIKQHREAYMRFAASGAVYGRLGPWATGYEPAAKAHDADYEDVMIVGIELVKVVPTTLAGVLALLSYVDEFNAGALYPPGDRYNWSSCPSMWPSHLIEDSGFNDDEDVDPFPWFLMRNVANALRTIVSVAS